MNKNRKVERKGLKIRENEEVESKEEKKRRREKRNEGYWEGKRRNLR